MRRSLRKRFLAVKKRQRQQKRALLVKRAVRHFKPRKADRLSFVFVNLKGKRQSSGSRAKGAMVYVNSKGKKAVVRYKARVALAPVKQTVFKLHGPTRKTAAKKFYEERTFKIKTGRVIKSEAEQSRGIDWRRFGNKAGKDLRNTVERFGRTRGQFIVNATVIVRYKDGKTRAIEITLNFNRGEFQHLTSKNYKKFMQQKVAEALGRALDFTDSVTKTSRLHIQRLKANKGKAKKDWIDKRGHRWFRNEATEVRVERIDYTINRVTVKS